MKIILLREQGSNVALTVSWRRLVWTLVAGVASIALGVVLFVQTAQPRNDSGIDTEVVSHWRAKLAEQDTVVTALGHKSQAESAAVGRQLAEMRARLLRMEAVGAHLAATANLDAEEFDFTNPPAQGGPIEAPPAHSESWADADLASELELLAAQIRQRERELNILDSVLVHEEFSNTSKVRGRPVAWGWLSSPFGKRVDPLTGKTAWHSGVDFAGRDGSDVIAVASGVVTFAGERSGYGRIVEISHANGIVTRYAHHKELLVNTGDVVKKGDVIGKMGSSGRSTGPHVHFEVEKGGRTVDPAGYVAKS